VSDNGEGFLDLLGVDPEHAVGEPESMRLVVAATTRQTTSMKPSGSGAAMAATARRRLMVEPRRAARAIAAPRDLLVTSVHDFARNCDVPGSTERLS